VLDPGPELDGLPLEDRRYATRRRLARDINFSALQELQFGPGHNPVFASAAEAYPAWIEHKNFLLANTNPGQRPFAFWLFEFGMVPPDDNGASVLWSMGELVGTELDKVMQNWREEFEFSHNCPLLTPAERRGRRRWADIPAELVRQWTRERRRQAEQIRQMATAEV
jgi:hypothetical protein